MKSPIASFLAIIVGGIWDLPNAEAELNPLEVENFKFFDSATGESVVLKGVAYYPRPNEGEWAINNVDFFTNEWEHVWRTDIEHFKDLGINAIRIYAIDPSANHDAFMCACEQAGIYVLVGLAANCEFCAITKDAAPDCYPPELKERGQFVISHMSKFPNVLGFSAGNEVGLVSPEDQSANAPCQKKFIRDMRAWLGGCDNLRQFPIGVVLADIKRTDKRDYYTCRGDGDEYENTQWMGLNSYVNCAAGVDSVEQSLGFQELLEEMRGLTVPLLLTEFGCLNQNWPTINGFEAQRTFAEARWMFQDPLRDITAGAFVFEFSVEKDNAIVEFPFDDFSTGNYGIGYYEPQDCTHVDINCTYVPKPEFRNLKEQYAKTPTRGPLNRGDFDPPQDRTTPPECPPNWDPISAFQWEPDNVDDLGCPEPGSVGYQCTASGPIYDTGSGDTTAENGENDDVDSTSDNGGDTTSDNGNGGSGDTDTNNDSDSGASVMTLGLSALSLMTSIAFV